MATAIRAWIGHPEGLNHIFVGMFLAPQPHHHHYHQKLYRVGSQEIMLATEPPSTHLNSQRPSREPREADERDLPSQMKMCRRSQITWSTLEITRNRKRQDPTALPRETSETEKGGEKRQHKAQTVAVVFQVDVGKARTKSC